MSNDRVKDKGRIPVNATDDDHSRENDPQDREDTAIQEALRFCDWDAKQDLTALQVALDFAEEEKRARKTAELEALRITEELNMIEAQRVSLATIQGRDIAITQEMAFLDFAQQAMGELESVATRRCLADDVAGHTCAMLQAQYVEALLEVERKATDAVSDYEHHSKISTRKVELAAAIATTHWACQQSSSAREAEAIMASIAIAEADAAEDAERLAAGITWLSQTWSLAQAQQLALAQRSQPAGASRRHRGPAASRRR